MDKNSNPSVKNVQGEQAGHDPEGVQHPVQRHPTDREEAQGPTNPTGRPAEEIAAAEAGQVLDSKKQRAPDQMDVPDPERVPSPELRREHTPGAFKTDGHDAKTHKILLWSDDLRHVAYSHSAPRDLFVTIAGKMYNHVDTADDGTWIYRSDANRA